MLIVILSPTLAYLSDYFRSRLSISKNIVVIFIVLSTFPSLIVWLSGYDYSDTRFLAYAMMLIGLSLFLGFYTLIDNRVALNAAITALSTLTIASITLMGQFAATYSGRGRELIAESKFRNYIALELGPQLYEDEKILRVMKTQLYGFIEKKIFETSYIDSSSAINCKYFIEDNKTSLVYDLCMHQLNHAK